MQEYRLSGNFLLSIRVEKMVFRNVVRLAMLSRRSWIAFWSCFVRLRITALQDFRRRPIDQVQF